VTPLTSTASVERIYWCHDRGGADGDLFVWCQLRSQELREGQPHLEDERCI
jgi:hypothetical protein